MNKKKVFFRLLIVLALVGFILMFSASCTTTKNAGVTIQEGTTEAGQQGARKASNADEKIEDAGISSAIKMKFAKDELVSDSNINVDTTKGHVTLNGTVDSVAEATRALQIGRSVSGVKSVHSNLIVALRRK